jgi:uncharacterized membrane protein
MLGVATPRMPQSCGERLRVTAQHDATTRLRGTYWERLRRATTPPRVVLAVLIAIWMLLFYRLGALRHDRFSTFGFDLGIYDQAAWLLAHFRDPFMTVRGIDTFGHHGTLVFWLFAPGYWLGGGPKFLLFVQVLSQASGALAIFLLARDRVGGRFAEWVGTTLAAVYLMHPTSQWLVWEFFHPDTFAIGPLLFAYWAARSGRWRWFWVAAVLAISCKEDVALALIVIGVLVAARHHVRRGVVIAGFAAIWYLAVTRVLLPWRNGVGPFYEKEFFGDLGGSPLAVLGHLVAHPSETWHLLFAKDRRAYYWTMFAPVALVLPFIEPQVLLIGLPMLGINAISAQSFTRDYRYHYSALVLAAIMLATVEAVAFSWRCARGPKRDLVPLVLSSLLVVTSLAGWHFAGAGPGSRAYAHGAWPLRDGEHVWDLMLGVDAGASPRAALAAHAVSLVPPGAPVSAVYNLLPHLSDRELAYEFPNPWIPSNWGLDNENQHDPGRAQYLVLDRLDFAGTSSSDIAQRELVDHLLTHEFRTVFEQQVADEFGYTHDLVVAKRVHSPMCIDHPSAVLLDALGSHYATVAPPSTGKVCPVT